MFNNIFKNVAAMSLYEALKNVKSEEDVKDAF